jgi:hypothetical protein
MAWQRPDELTLYVPESTSVLEGHFTVETHSDQQAPDPVSELVRHLDAARRAATHLTSPAA